MTLDKVMEFAKENGYETAERVEDWNGYECYEPVEEEGVVSFTGPPLLILVRGEEIRMSTVEEGFLQMEETCGDEEE